MELHRRQSELRAKSRTMATKVVLPDGRIDGSLRLHPRISRAPLEIEARDFWDEAQRVVALGLLIGASVALLYVFGPASRSPASLGSVAAPVKPPRSGAATDPGGVGP